VDNVSFSVRRSLPARPEQGIPFGLLVHTFEIKSHAALRGRSLIRIWGVEESDIPSFDEENDEGGSETHFA